VGVIETDYLVVGAGTTGMAFTDALVANADVDVVMVDRRHDPGGHWNDAYPFVRLHQPAATYGVNSTPLGRETIDTVGPNAGFYERATGTEVVAYFRKVLDDVLLPSGKVRFLGGCDYVGNWSSDHALVSGLTGTSTDVTVRRAVVDTTFTETSVPATHRPPLMIADGVRFIPVGRLVDVADGPEEFTILGAGKTAMDACNWLLDNDVDPERIRWIRPRDAWLTPRATFQPLDLIGGAVESLGGAVEALANAGDVDDLFHRLEDDQLMLRLDSSVWPSMYRGPLVSDPELAALRQVQRVVRLGRVKKIEAQRIVLDGGEIPTSPRHVHVDCTASGFRSVDPRPIFEPGRITPQSFMGGFISFTSAVIGYVEATRDNEDEKNRLCVPTRLPDKPIDWIRSYHGGLTANMLHGAEPDLNAWIEASRLNTQRGMTAHAADPEVAAGLTRMIGHLGAALANAERLMATA
jgi:hypothetical protein